MHIIIHLSGPVGEQEQWVHVMLWSTYEESNTKAKIDVDAYVRASFYACCWNSNCFSDLQYKKDIENLKAGQTIKDENIPLKTSEGTKLKKPEISHPCYNVININ